MEDNSYSIFEIVNQNIKLVVPLYQRLFAWGEEQITTILHDIFKKYNENKEKADNEKEKYYIGMITIINNNNEWELIDGQQRMTFLYLLSIFLHLKTNINDKIFDKFCLYSNADNKKVDENKSRLEFACRENDNKYIIRLFNSENIESTLQKDENYYNEKMNNALKNINKFFGDKIIEEEFLTYICNDVVFFVSELPENYKKSPKLLNKYFERMNESGKNLENVEILKVDIIAKLEKDDQKKYLEIWNKISDFDKMFLSENKEEVSDDYRKKYLDSIYKKSENIYEKVNNKNNQNESFDNLNNITSEKYEFNKNNLNDDRTYRALIKFDEFLLLTLYSFYKEIFYNKNNMKEIETENNADIVFTNIEIKVDDFFNTNNLLETFKKMLFNDKLNENIEDNKNRFKNFLDLLLKYKLIFDYYIIRTSTKNDSYDYELRLLSSENDNEKYKNKYIKYMSMMYVSSSAYTYYKWLPDLLIFLSKPKEIEKINSMQICAETLYNKILEIDNRWHPTNNLNDDDLTYEKIDRYWLWKIDYLLWENREKIFDKEYIEIADKYVFKRNRSIEHIEPQHPKGESIINWNEIEDGNKKLNSIGNLALISSGLNSSLSNSSINEKMAHVKDYINSNTNGSIESLKLLWTYIQYDKIVSNENEPQEKIYVENIFKYKEFFINLLKKNTQEWN